MNVSLRSRSWRRSGTETQSSLGSTLVQAIPLALFVLAARALTHFYYPLGSHVLDEIWDLTCLGIALSGVVLRAIATGYGAPRFDEMPRTLSTSGIFSLMRHPHMLGTLLIYAGAIFFMHDIDLTLVAIVLLWIYARRRMIDRDRQLSERFGTRFERWAANTSAIFPVFTHWTAPVNPFNWRRVLLYEHQSLVLTAIVFAALEVGGHFAVDRTLEVEGWWVVFLAFSAGLTCLVNGLKRWSGFLNNVDGGSFETPGL